MPGFWRAPRGGPAMRTLHLASLSLALAACNKAAGSPLDTRRADVSAHASALAINEVAAAGAPDDWFEVINTGTTPVDLSDFVYVDSAGALERARAFPGFVLAPGERHVQYVTGAVAGFQLASDESLYLYRADGALVDAI